MHRILLGTGIVVIIVGVVLLGTFPWAFYKSAGDVNSDEYNEGDKITVYGVVTDVKYVSIINKTLLEVDGNLTVYLDGKVTKFKVGDYIFLTIERVDQFQYGNFKISYWSSSEDDVHYVSDMQFYFYILIVIGVVLAAISLFLR